MCLTLSQHPYGTTLPQTAVLALSPHVHVHLTAAATFTVIHGLFSHASPEEPCGGKETTAGCKSVDLKKNKLKRVAGDLRKYLYIPRR